MIDEFTKKDSSSMARLATMSHSSIRKQGDIWKRAPKEKHNASTTPPARPSNSFVEKILRDCLKPRSFEVALVEDRKRTSTPTSQSADKGTNSDYSEPRKHSIPVKDYSYITPPRKSRDSRHDPLGYSRGIPDDPRTVPPPSSKSSLLSYSGRMAGGARRTNPPSTSYLQQRHFENLANDTKTALMQNASSPRPRHHVFFADTAIRTMPARRSGYMQPLDFGSSTSGAGTTIGSSKWDHSRDDGIVANGGTITSPPTSKESRDFGIIGIESPRAHNNYRHQPRYANHTKRNTPRRPSSRDIFHPRRGNPSFSQPPPYSSSSLTFSSFQEEREQALRDYKVTIEYKHLKSHAPGGVYLIPSMDSLRNFHGIIFVRRGPFTNGIFKFRLDLPAKYNDTNMWPKITFSSKVYNPYVNEKTGELDVQTAYPTWDPSRHYLVTVLTFLKKIFYSKNFADAKANPAARELFEKDPAAYKKKVEACVHESQKKVYVNEKGSTAKFTEEEVAHRVLRDLLKHHIRNENQVTKQTILAQVEKSRKV